LHSHIAGLGTCFWQSCSYSSRLAFNWAAVLLALLSIYVC